MQMFPPCIIASPEIYRRHYLSSLPTYLKSSGLNSVNSARRQTFFVFSFATSCPWDAGRQFLSGNARTDRPRTGHTTCQTCTNNQITCVWALDTIEGCLRVLHTQPPFSFQNLLQHVLASWRTRGKPLDSRFGWALRMKGKKGLNKQVSVVIKSDEHLDSSWMKQPVFSSMTILDMSMVHVVPA